MITILAPFPRTNEVDGYIQRIRQIDKILEEVPRIYIRLQAGAVLSLEWHSCSWSLVMEVIVDPDTPEGSKWITQIIQYSTLVYSHSLFPLAQLRADSLDWLLNQRKLILDLHGVVPEESALSGDLVASERLANVEARCCRESLSLVSVTHAMQSHFEHKYSADTHKKSFRWFVIPVVPSRVFLRKVASFRPRDRELHAAIYVGGIQPWQNLPLVGALLTNPSVLDCLTLDVLTPDVEGVKSLLGPSVVPRTIVTVKNEDVPKHLLLNAWGFLLRDDNVVNRVACPTKVYEYMAADVVPVVLQPNIGDLREGEYGYVVFQEFQELIKSGNLESKYLASRERNQEVLGRVLKAEETAGAQLRLFIHSQNSASKTWFPLSFAVHLFFQSRWVVDGKFWPIGLKHWVKSRIKALFS